MGRFVKGQKYNYSETLGVLVEAKTQEEANTLYAELLEYCISDSPEKSTEELENILRSNLGYYAGYYDRTTQMLVETLYGAVHSSLHGDTVDAEEAFKKGVELGKALTPNEEL